MKSFLYAAAALMIGASIYGFVDYSKTRGQKEFTGMYDEKETTKPAIVNEKRTPGEVVQTGSGYEPVAATDSKVKEEKVREEGSIVKQLVKKFKKKRKVDFENFSRAPLREGQEIREVPALKEEMRKEQ